MASILYREVDGKLEELYVEYDQYESSISAGWSPEKPGEKKAEPKKGPSDDDIRAAAKEAGIDGWETKRIATLRKALESK